MLAVEVDDDDEARCGLTCPQLRHIKQGLYRCNAFTGEGYLQPFHEDPPLRDPDCLAAEWSE